MKPESPRMMLGFVVRQCAVELGHSPEPAELVEWANNRRGFKGTYRVFGRMISIEEAELILRNLDRLVTIHPDWESRRAPARALEEPAKVIDFARIRRAR